MSSPGCLKLIFQAGDVGLALPIGYSLEGLYLMKKQKNVFQFLTHGDGCVLINSFNTDLGSADSVPGDMLGAGDTVPLTERPPCGSHPLACVKVRASDLQNNQRPSQPYLHLPSSSLGLLREAKGLQDLINMD